MVVNVRQRRRMGNAFHLSSITNGKIVATKR